MSLSPVASVMAQAIRRTMRSPEWFAATGADDERAWLLLMALCAELHPLGSVSVPSPDRLDQLTDRLLRDEDIWRSFDGRNYETLAAKHRLTSRQVRRIIERMRQRNAPETGEAV